MKQTVIGFALMVLGLTPAFAGKFSTWTGGKTEVTIRVPDPPQAYLGKKTVRVQVGQMPGEIGSDRMRLMIEQGLTPEMGISADNPEAIIGVAVVNYRPPESKQYTVNEQQYIKVGEKTVYNKKGQPSQQDVYDNRAVPVQYWEGSAALSLHVDVKARDGALLDSFDPQPVFNLKVKTAVGSEYTQAAHTIPDRNRMVEALVQEAANEIRKRYTRTDRNEMVVLAIDDELKAGNALAQAGKWEDALKMWDSVNMKKNQADRTYNMAVAYEVLAYEAYQKNQDVEEASKSFGKAMDMYASAMQQDPGEKYIRMASARIARAKESMDRSAKQYAAQQFELQKRQQEITARKEKEQEIKSAMAEGVSGGKDIQQADSPAEARFRLFVRTRLSDSNTEPTDQDTAALIDAGQKRYQVDPERGRHVVYQEIGWKRNHDQGLKAYRDDFSIYAKDGIITADERSLLQDTAKQYNLAPEDIEKIESAFKVREPGKAVKSTPAPARPKRSPAPAKSLRSTSSQKGN